MEEFKKLKLIIDCAMEKLGCDGDPSSRPEGFDRLDEDELLWIVEDLYVLTTEASSELNRIINLKK